MIPHSISERTSTMRYPIAIEMGDTKTAFGVAVPDLPGCFSAGDTLDEAVANAEEAILLHLEGLVDCGKAPPHPSPLDKVRKSRKYRGWALAVVNVDLSKLSDKATRVNITVPERILSAIDSYAEKKGESRSAFLTRAAMEAMAR